MATFLNKESNQKKLSSREDHYRKAHALYASVSNDYEDARLRMIEYEYAPNAVEQVMEVHSKIVAAKKGRMVDAKEDLNRCVDRYNNLCDDLKSPQGNDDVASKDGSESTSKMVLQVQVKMMEAKERTVVNVTCLWWRKERTRASQIYQPKKR